LSPDLLPAPTGDPEQVSPVVVVDADGDPARGAFEECGLAAAEADLEDRAVGHGPGEEVRAVGRDAFGKPAIRQLDPVCQVR
jgi:hypothetical protein